jgi:hypothetical protein
MPNQESQTMTKPPSRRLAAQVPPKPAPSPAKPARTQESPTQLTPAKEKIGEGAGNLKAREAAYKRRSGAA